MKFSALSVLTFVLAFQSVGAFAQNQSPVKKWAWEQIQEVGVNRADDLTVLSGLLDDDVSVKAITFGTGNKGTGLDRLCYDSIIKVMENPKKYQLVMSTDPEPLGAITYRVLNCTLKIRSL